MKSVFIHPRIVTFWREIVSDSCTARHNSLYAIKFSRAAFVARAGDRSCSWGSVTGPSKISLFECYCVGWPWWTCIGCRVRVRGRVNWPFFPYRWHVAFDWIATLPQHKNIWEPNLVCLQSTRWRKLAAGNIVHMHISCCVVFFSNRVCIC